MNVMNDVFKVSFFSILFCIGAFYCIVLCWLDGFAVDYLLICQTKESITPGQTNVNLINVHTDIHLT